MPDSSTIAAIATPPGQGAISLIRITGDQALDIAEKLFFPFPSPLVPRFQNLGKCRDRDGSIIDEVLLTWFEGPASFTGEDVVELCCHGGYVVTRCLLERVLELGATPAQPGEFSQRAVLNGKIDLTQAEAIMDLISARTDLAAKAAGEQLAGRLGNEMESLRETLIEILAHVEAFIDFPDEDIDPESEELIENRIVGVISRVDQLLDTADRGRILREGIKTVLCGAPNAGKSSLLNHLVGFDRAIVSHRPGTTRDTIEETINLDGIPLRIIDTAGIRESKDEIEQAGIERAQDQMKQAELVLLLLDSTEDDLTIPIPDGVEVVRILNKTDLPSHSHWKDDDSAISISCLTGKGIAELRKHIVKTVTGAEGGLQHGELVAINTRHLHYLTSAKSFLEAALQQLAERVSPEFVSFELHEALAAIGSIVGKTDIEEILGSIFSSFCIGK